MSNEDLNLGIQTDLSIFAGTMVEMTWVEVKQSAADGAILLFPVGIIEAHGPHMDLSPDVYMAYLFCKYLKQTLENKGILSIIAPPIIGVSVRISFYPQKVNVNLAKELTPQKGFDPLGYRGDPASFYLEKDVFEYYKADLEMDSLKIEAILKQR